MVARSLQTRKATRRISVKFVSTITATLAFYGFNLSGKRFMFSFQNSRRCLFFKAKPNDGALATNIGSFGAGVTREVSCALSGENKYFDLGKNKTHLWR